MKILRLMRSADPAHGGPAEGARQINAALLARGHEITTVTLDAPNSSFLEQFPGGVLALGPGLGGYGYSTEFRHWLMSHRTEFDAVIVNGLWQYQGFAAWQVFSGTDCPYFVFAHGMLDPWFKRTYPLKHLKKWLYWPWGEYRVLRDARAVIFTSEEERLLARQSFSLYRAREVVTAYGTSGFGAQPAAVLKERFLDGFPMLRGKRLVLYLGRIHEKKGCDLLLEAFASVAHSDAGLHLVMAGPSAGSLSSQLQARASALGIEGRVTWPGMLQGEMKWGAFHAAEVFCLPSHQENFGIVVAEALSCSKPVLISNKVNIWREIQQDGVGFVAEDSLEGTRENLVAWLSLSETQRRVMENAARSSFESRFIIGKVAESVERILEGGRHGYSGR